MDMRIYDAWLLTVTLIESIAIIITNGFMVATFARNPKLLTPMNCYICSMCFSGLVTGLLVPLGFGPFIGPNTFTGALMNPCDVQKYKTVVFYATACNSIFCMLAIAVERWRTLSTTVRRRGTNRLAKISIVVGWTTSVAYAAILSSISSATDVRIEFDDVADPSCSTIAANRTICSDYRVCYPISQYVFWQMEIYHIITLILVFIIPLCTISVIYCLLVKRLLRNVDKGNRGLSGTHRAKLRAIQAMVLVVIIFAICWLPGHIFVIWSMNHMMPDLEQIQLTSSVQKIPIRNRILNDFVTHLTFSHHWIHTLIYPRYSRQIAKAIRETLSSLINVIPLPSLTQRNPPAPKPSTGRDGDSTCVKTS